MTNFIKTTFKVLFVLSVAVLAYGVVCKNINPVNGLLGSIKNGSHNITAEILSSELLEAKTLNTVICNYSETASLDSANAHWYIFEIPNTGSVTQATYSGKLYYGINLADVSVSKNADGSITVRCPKAYKMAHEIDLANIDFRSIRNGRLANFQNSTADVYTIFTRELAEIKTAKEKQFESQQGEIDDKSRRKLKEFIDSLGFNTANVVVVSK